MDTEELGRTVRRLERRLRQREYTLHKEMLQLNKLRLEYTDLLATYGEIRMKECPAMKRGRGIYRCRARDTLRYSKHDMQTTCGKCRLTQERVRVKLLAATLGEHNDTDE